MKKAILTGTMAALILVSGCSGHPDRAAHREDNYTPVNSISESERTVPAAVSPESLGGISLGDTLEDVVGLLGEDYTETLVTDEAGYIGEDTLELEYKQGIVVTLGKESKRVIRVEVSSPGFPTYLGIQVGDRASSALVKYKSTFKEAQSRHDNSTLSGWFHVGDEKVIIFDFDSEDGTRVNGEITPDSAVQEMVLAYWRHFD
ncbi:MAG: hypothetical protein GXY97_02800 [Clostridiales bacterium]|jgi:hypothetical protein|nr:hypothetical protein [Clostridiales bacterium]HQA47919.1 hypothetical protein [Bacillota bacterium]